MPLQMFNNQTGTNAGFAYKVNVTTNDVPAYTNGANNFYTFNNFIVNKEIASAGFLEVAYVGKKFASDNGIFVGLIDEFGYSISETTLFKPTLATNVFFSYGVRFSLGMFNIQSATADNDIAQSAPFTYTQYKADNNINPSNGTTGVNQISAVYPSRTLCVNDRIVFGIVQNSASPEIVNGTFRIATR